MPDTIFPTSEKPQAVPPSQPAEAIGTAADAPEQRREAQQTWDTEGGSNALHQPPAETPTQAEFDIQALITEHPLAAAGAAMLAGALVMGLLVSASGSNRGNDSSDSDGSKGSRKHPERQVTRRGRRHQREFMDELRNTTQAILRAVTERV